MKILVLEEGGKIKLANFIKKEKKTPIYRIRNNNGEVTIDTQHILSQKKTASYISMERDFKI